MQLSPESGIRESESGIRESGNPGIRIAGPALIVVLGLVLGVLMGGLLSGVSQMGQGALG